LVLVLSLSNPPKIGNLFRQAEQKKREARRQHQQPDRERYPACH
jgi:hypothetical protein